MEVKSSTDGSALTRDFVINGLMAIASDPKTSEKGRLTAFKILGGYLGPAIPERVPEAAEALSEPPQDVADEGDDMRLLVAGAVKH